MLDAQDESSVMSWTQRQLGESARRAAILELNKEVLPEWVEKSGTGISQAGCGAFASVTADSIQSLAGTDRNVFSCLGKVHSLEIKKTSIH